MTEKHAPLRPFDAAQAKDIFDKAGIPVSHMFEMINQYWPRVPAYYTDLVGSPWFAVVTDFGIITIGWRKRVIAISWNGCEYRGRVTDDGVTQRDDLVHAYSEADAVKYLTSLHHFMKC